ncbi:hypothetical protein AA650_05370 [Anabaena sp. WA102]|nr:hypothetical protein AA650_05370 [Anabaena sp. WA102]
MVLRDFQLKKYPKISCGAGILRQAQYKSCPLIIKDGQDAHPTKLGNLFFGVPLKNTGYFDTLRSKDAEIL